MDPSSCSTLTSYPTPLIIPGAIFYSDFDDNTTNITGKSAPGTWFGSAQYTTGKVGQGANLNGSSYIKLDGLPVNTAANSKTTVAFWMRWGGIHDKIPLTIGNFSLWLIEGYFGFNTGNAGDLRAISSNSFANTWVHVVGVFNNGSYTQNKLYINGELKPITTIWGAPYAAAAVSNLLVLGHGGYYAFTGIIDEIGVWNRELTGKEILMLYNSY